MSVIVCLKGRGAYARVIVGNGTGSLVHPLTSSYYPLRRRSNSEGKSSKYYGRDVGILFREPVNRRDTPMNILFPTRGD
ncbi:hypothetical protein EVAR_665_1 [Eumeta japonica]|uniref:Uncharacterized protein n=1 Tax=Eumeta variegata TaxID=151549 RepID=A0A4C1SE87_EUMVA|nr:hypothetical protein EVAR_665_1 [Eumeta japonica]